MELYALFVGATRFRSPRRPASGFVDDLGQFIKYRIIARKESMNLSI